MFTKGSLLVLFDHKIRRTAQQEQERGVMDDSMENQKCVSFSYLGFPKISYMATC